MNIYRQKKIIIQTVAEMDHQSWVEYSSDLCFLSNYSRVGIIVKFISSFLKI